MSWPSPSPSVRELIRQGAELALHTPDVWRPAVDEATLSPAVIAGIAADPALSEAMRTANYDNMLAWATANIRAPGEPVTANVSATQLDFSRDLVRRGLHEAALYAFRTGQNVAWQQWMQICFRLTRDADELEELLTVTAASIGAYIEATVAALAERINAERHELTSGSQAERRDLVALILEGAPVPKTRADSVLAHRVDGKHTAALIWTPEHESDLGRLERAAEALMRASGAHQRLTVIASATTLWVWLPIAALPDREELGVALRRTPEVRVAVGTPSRGVEGFRRSHQDAAEVRRLVARLGTQAQLVTFEEVQLASLVTRDSARSKEFVVDVLGDFRNASLELRETVRIYLEALGNTSATAARLFTHRNTVIRRLTRADALLPQPLLEDPLRIAVALDLLRWHASEV